MDHTIALIQKSHEGDEEARAQIVEENTGLNSARRLLTSSVKSSSE